MPILPALPRQTPPPVLKVTFLGTSAASDMGRQPTSALLIQYGEELILVDCGTRALAQLRNAGYEASDLTAVVITHWHADHTAGLLRVLASANAGKAAGEPGLEVWAPPLPKSISDHLDTARYLPQFVPVQHGAKLSLPGATLTAVRANHTIEGYSWIFQETGGPRRKIAISGDTRPSALLMAAARKADLLIHESTYSSKNLAWAQTLGHSTARQAAELAGLAKVGALAITHISAREIKAEVLAEARQSFPGAFMPGDLATIEVLPAGLRRRNVAGWGRIERTQISEELAS